MSESMVANVVVAGVALACAVLAVLGVAMYRGAKQIDAEYMPPTPRPWPEVREAVLRRAEKGERV